MPCSRAHCFKFMEVDCSVWARQLLSTPVGRRDARASGRDGAEPRPQVDGNGSTCSAVGVPPKLDPARLRATARGTGVEAMHPNPVRVNVELPMDQEAIAWAGWDPRAEAEVVVELEDVADPIRHRQHLVATPLHRRGEHRALEG